MATHAGVLLGAGMEARCTTISMRMMQGENITLVSKPSMI